MLFPLADEIDGQSCLSDLFSDGTWGEGKSSDLSAGNLTSEPVVLAIMLCFPHTRLPGVGQQRRHQLLWVISSLVNCLLHGGRDFVSCSGLFSLFLHYVDIVYCNWVLFPQFEDQKLTMLEAGCGVGNCLFPLLEEDPDIFAYACDFSPRAVEYVKVGAPSICSIFLDLLDLNSTPVFPIPVLFLEDQL